MCSFINQFLFQIRYVVLITLILFINSLNGTKNKKPVAPDPKSVESEEGIDLDLKIPGLSISGLGIPGLDIPGLDIIQDLTINRIILIFSQIIDFPKLIKLILLLLGFIAKVIKLN